MVQILAYLELVDHYVNIILASSLNAYLHFLAFVSVEAYLNRFPNAGVAVAKLVHCAVFQYGPFFGAYLANLDVDFVDVIFQFAVFLADDVVSMELEDGFCSCGEVNLAGEYHACVVQI